MHYVVDKFVSESHTFLRDPQNINNFHLHIKNINFMTLITRCVLLKTKLRHMA